MLMSTLIKEAGALSKKNNQTDAEDHVEEEERVVKKQKVEEKKPLTSPGEKQKDGSIRYELTSTKFLTVKVFKNHKYVDLREFYDKNGEMHPGRKGICLTLDQWHLLSKIHSHVLQAIEELEAHNEISIDSDEKITLESTETKAVFRITDTRRITVEKFHGRVLANVREYYRTDSGDLKPGKKGIALMHTQWKHIGQIAESVEQSINEL